MRDYRGPLRGFATMRDTIIMSLLFVIFVILPLAYLTFSVFYHIFFAVSYFVIPAKIPGKLARRHKYLLFIPAHNEESIMPRILTSVRHIEYDRRNFEVWVIADNCTDGTARVARRYGSNVLTRYDESKKGKGFALKWALKVMDIDRFDAVVIADADSIFDPYFFHGLDDVIGRGLRAVQCNNCLANSDETMFTKIIHISRTTNNLLYHEAKYKLGLSSYLMGNGMCFTTDLLREHPWATGTMAEDYEYYAMLASSDEPVGFAVNSKLYHQESKNLQRASRQRLRWSTGRFEVARKFGIKLLLQGLEKKNLRIVDASFPLLLPNLSLMVNMSIVGFIVTAAISWFYPLPYLILWLAMLIAFEVLYLIGGMYLAKVPAFSFLRALCFAPFFLVWKGCIDILGLSGIRGGEWGRSGRR